MRIIKIEAFENGAHDNQSWGTAPIPEGWAKIPEEMETPGFPFGEIETEEKDGIVTVTKWTAGEMPEEEETEQEMPVSEIEQLRADVDYIAVMTGVEL